MEPLTIIIIVNSILTTILLSIFCSYILKKHSLKNPIIDKSEEEQIKIKLNKYEWIMFLLAILSSVLFLVENILGSAYIIFSFVIVFIVIISILFKKALDIKLGNKMCLITLIILTVIFFIKPIYCNNYNICSQSNGYEEITPFNVKFEQYEGEKTGSQVKTLIQDCLSSNINEDNINRLVSVAFYKKDNNGNYSAKPDYLIGDDPSYNDNR